ncbi:hypothetical protein PHJA_001923400 [Phtheirospermum japonicum]|uniref:KIB1-4 beta-propeller domain-containing protein n=1 Tax=Phtheirospermum japonicum TaxID=374723 RepID=A0A830CPH4_9LAMI|nr:hypothetical protein PHJA_001923400 [Phtheirospermum japonicum]
MTRHDHSLFFFNPSNNQRVDLPGPSAPGYTTVCFFNPPTSPDCTVVGIATPLESKAVEICFLKRGKGDWRQKYKYDTSYKFQVLHGAPVMHRGLIYFLDVKGYVATFDMSISYNRLRRRWIGGKNRERYLLRVEGEEEDQLFAVFVFDDERKCWKMWAQNKLQRKKYKHSCLLTHNLIMNSLKQLIQNSCFSNEDLHGYL